MPFELTDNVHVAEDDQGNIRHLEHFLRPFVASNTVPADSRQAAALEATDAPSTVALTPQALAQQYLQEVAPVYQFDPNMLPESGGAEARLAEPAAGKLELTEENELMGTTTISYQQTYRGLPVWEAGISVTIQPQPMRVTASQSSVHSDLSLPEDALGAVPVYRPENAPRAHQRGYPYHQRHATAYLPLRSEPALRPRSWSLFDGGTAGKPSNARPPARARYHQVGPTLPGDRSAVYPSCRRLRSRQLAGVR